MEKNAIAKKILSTNKRAYVYVLRIMQTTKSPEFDSIFTEGKLGQIETFNEFLLQNIVRVSAHDPNHIEYGRNKKNDTW